MLIAHLSDLHLLSLVGVRAVDFLGKRVTGGANLLLNRGGKYPVEVARALVRDVNAQRPRHVLVSGDLTNLAFPAEFALARSVLDELELPPSEITVVPGNHDAYTRGAARADVFGRVMREHLRGELQPGPGAFPLLRLRDELAVLALSSARPSAPLLATGTLGVRQLRWTAKLLRAPECRDRFRLVVLHHAPLRARVHWHNRLTDAVALRVIVTRAGAELVVHGHLHRFLRQSLPGTHGEIAVVGVGSGTWLSPHDPARRAQYNLYEIEGGRLARVRVRRYEPSTGQFEAWEPGR